MKTMLKAAMLTAGLFVASAGALVAQDAPAVPDFAAPAAAPAAPAVQSTELAANPDQSQPAATKKSSTGFWAVVTGSGGLGVILWLYLFGAGVASIYFVFDCATKMLLAETCGAEIENTFTAPEGFSYRWYDITRPDSTLATTQSLHVAQIGEYHCAMQFVGASTTSSCSFELVAIASERYPVAAFTLDSTDRTECNLPLTLHNTSLDTAHTQLTTHPCDFIHWLIDGDSISDASTLHCSLVPGRHTITLVASLRGGCTDTVTKSLFVWNPCYVADTIAATICQGQSYTLFDTTISEPGTYIRDSAYHHRTLMLSVNPTSDTVITRSVKEALFPYSFAGISFSAAVADTSIILANSHNCDSTIHFTLIPLPNSLTTVDSSVCQNLLPLVWNGITFSHSDTLSVTIVDAASNGADSIVTMQLHVKPTYQSFDTIAICDNQFPYIWNDTILNPTGTAQFKPGIENFNPMAARPSVKLVLMKL